MLRDIGEIQKLATKYSKPQLARMAQMGLIDPTKAVMAGMMIDRITKSNMQSPQRTVADEALGQAPMPMPNQQQMQPAPAGIGGLPPQQAPNAGVAALPSGITEMADGGIVAFAGEGPSLVEQPAVNFDEQLRQIKERERQEEAARLETERKEKSRTSALFTGYEALDANQRQGMATTIRQKMQNNIPLTESEKGLLQSVPQFKNMVDAEMARFPAAVNQPTLTNTTAPAPAPAPAARQDTRGRPGAIQSAGTRQGPAAPSAEQPSGMQSLLTNRVPEFKLDPNIGKFETEKYKMPEKKELKDYLRQQEEADRAAGVNTNIYKDLMGDLETKKGKLANRKQEAIGTALMQTGLGLLGARRGQEFAVLGEAGQRSLQGLVAANERIRETEEKIDDARRSLLVAENDYKRTRSDKALDRVERNTERIENLEIKNVDNINTANQERAKIGVLTQGQGIELQRNRITEEGNIRTAAINLETERMRNRQSEINARISAAAQNRPGESERLMAQYENIQKTQGQEAANAWLSNLERVRGAGKPQNTFSYEEALKIVAAQTGNIRATPQELARQARELVEASKPQPGGISRLGGSVDTSNPLLQGG